MNTTTIRPTTTETTMSRHTTLTKISAGNYITAADHDRMTYYAAIGRRGEWTVARMELGNGCTVLGTVASIAAAERLIVADRIAA